MFHPRRKASPRNGRKAARAAGTIFLEKMEERQLLSWPGAPFGDAVVVHVNQFGQAEIADSIASAGHYSKFLIYFDSAGPLSIQTYGGTDTELAYYAQPGTPSQTDDDSGDGLNSMVNVQAATWTPQYVAVRGWNEIMTGAYLLAMDGPDAAARPVTIDGQSHGRQTDSIGAAYDSDFFSFVPDVSRDWTVSVSPRGSWDVQMTLFDSSGGPVAGDFVEPVDERDEGGDETWTGPLMAGQTYYVRVDGYGGQTGTYDVDLQGGADTTPPAVSSVHSTMGGTVEITFTEAMDIAGVDNFFDVWVTDSLGGEVSGSISWSADSMVLTWSPSGPPPQEADEWTITLSGGSEGLADVSGNILDGDADGSAGGDFDYSWSVIGPDITAPAVASASLDTASGTATIDFTEAMQTSSARYGTDFTVTAGGSLVAGSILWSNGGTRMTWTPTNPPPSAGVDWTITLSGQPGSGVTDLALNVLDGDSDDLPGGNYVATWHVQSPDSTPPTVVSAVGGDEGSVIVTFSEPMGAGVGLYGIYDSSDALLPGSSDWLSQTEWRWHPVPPAMSPDRWRLTLSSHVFGFADRAGNMLDADGDGSPGGEFVMSWDILKDLSPRLGSLEAGANLVHPGDGVTLIAAGGQGRITGVAFYRDNDGDGSLDADDEEFAVDNTYVLDCSAWVPPSILTPGTHSFLARAFNETMTGNLVQATVRVNVTPVISGTILPDRRMLKPGSSVRLSLAGITGSQADMSVSFYRDANNNGWLDDSDVLVGTESAGADGQWEAPATVASAPGMYTFFAQAFDGYEKSNVVSTQVEVLSPVFMDSRRRITRNINAQAVTLSLSGAGEMVAYVSSQSSAPVFPIIDVSGGAASSLKITSKSGVSVGDINVGTSLGAITGPTVSLLGDVTVAGSLKKLLLNDVPAGNEHLLTVGPAASLRDTLSITLGKVSGLSVDSGMPIKSIRAVEWIAGSQTNILHAPAIMKLATTGAWDSIGSLEANVDVTTLGSVSVKGLAGGQWTVAMGKVSSISAISSLDGWSLTAPTSAVGKLAFRNILTGNVDVLSIASVSASSVKSASMTLRLQVDPRVKISALGKLTATELWASRILSAGNIGTIAVGSASHSGVYAGWTSEPSLMPTADEVAASAQATIGSFSTRRGMALWDSYISAATIGNVLLKEIQTFPGQTYGIVAHSIKSYTRYELNAIVARYAPADGVVPVIDTRDSYECRLV